MTGRATTPALEDSERPGEVPRDASPAEVAGAEVEAAFRAFAAEQAAPKSVRVQARALGVPEDVAADMTQEALLALWHRRDAIAVSRWPGWFQKTMLRGAYRYSRSRRRAKKYEPAIAFELSLHPSRPSPEVELHLRECEVELSRLIGILQPERREVVQLYLVEELPMKEIAERLGIPENTAKNRWRLAQQDMGAAFRRGTAKERFAALVATLWAFLAALWTRITGKGTRGRVPIVASAILALVVSQPEEPAEAAGGEEMADVLPSSSFEYTFSPSLTAFAERERAAVVGREGGDAMSAPRSLLAQAAAAILAGRREVARSCLSQYRAAYGVDPKGPFTDQYKALMAELASR